MIRLLLAVAGVALIAFQGWAVASVLPPSAICAVRGEVVSIEGGKLTATIFERTLHEQRMVGACAAVTEPEIAVYALTEEDTGLEVGDTFTGHVEYTGDEFAQGHVIYNIQKASGAAPNEGSPE